MPVFWPDTPFPSTFFLRRTMKPPPGFALLLVHLAFIPIIYGLTFNDSACRLSLPTSNATNASLAGVVDAFGNPATSVADAFGYNYEACLTQCGTGAGPIEFITTVQQSTLWFLPYLTLLAQLPFVTKDKVGDVKVLLITLGSPMLALYSMFLTLSNWQWLKDFSYRLCVRARDDPESDLDFVLPEIVGRLQGFPITILDGDLLVSGLTFKENRQWWIELRNHLRDRERGLSASGLAQLLLAVIVYIFSVGEALSLIGGNSTIYIRFS
jgi:hypothetical protein